MAGLGHGSGLKTEILLPPLRLLALVLLLAGCGPADPPPESEGQAAASGSTSVPRLEIGHTLGSDSAPIEVVEFSDFGCSSCAEFAVESLPALRAEFVDQGLVRWRYVPIRQGFLRGEEAAVAGECAARQGRFWPMHDALAEGRRDWQTRPDPFPVLAAYADSIGLDVPEFALCYRDNPGEPALRLNDMVALSIGVRGTPTFLVAGQRVFGALETERFASILRESLAARRGNAGGR